MLRFRWPYWHPHWDKDVTEQYPHHARWVRVFECRLCGSVRSALLSPTPPEWDWR